MDRTSIIVLILCMLAFFGWFFVINKLYPPKPATGLSQSNTVSSAQTTNTAPTASITATSTGTAPATTAAAAVPTANTSVPLADTNVLEQFMVVTNDKARYTFTTHGG